MITFVFSVHDTYWFSSVPCGAVYSDAGNKTVIEFSNR